MELDIDGQKDLSKYVQAADIPSELNKAYLMPIEDAGGLGAKLGGIFDPVLVSHQETLTQDTAQGSAGNFAPFIAVALGIGILFLILKVAK